MLQGDHFDLFEVQSDSMDVSGYILPELGP